jgi:hypothetical protein
MNRGRKIPKILTVFRLKILILFAVIYFNMRTLLKIIVIFSILSVSTLFATLNNNDTAFAICSELNDPNISCHEQYNSHSNTATSTTSTTTEDESDLMLCSDLKCNLGGEYLLDPETDVLDDPLDLLDY